MKPTILLISILTFAACTAAFGDWQVVETTNDLRTDSLHSATEDGRPLECRVWPEGDTVAVLLPDSRNLERPNHLPQCLAPAPPQDVEYRLAVLRVKRTIINRKDNE